MIRTAVVCMSLAYGPVVAHAQGEPDLASLTFSAGPVAGDFPQPAPAARDAPEPDAVPSADMTRRIEAIREAEAAISREERLNGPTSPGLIEQQASLAQLYRELGDYPLAIAALTRARQVIRINDGLYSLSQVEIIDAMADALEAVGAYYESDSLQDELLEIAIHNEGDARTPSVLAAVADRQMDAVRTYFEAGRWERSLERIEDAPGTGWDLQNIEFLRFSGKMPLKRHDTTIRELLTNGSYEIGDTLDARRELIETYAMIDAINDHNEAGQRRVAPVGFRFEPRDVQRDLALSAFRRARRLYRSAMQTLLESGDYGSGEYLAIEQKMIDTYYFELEHAELYPDLSTHRQDPRAILKPVVYGTGTSALEARVVNRLSRGTSAVEIARALMAVGDWHLLFSANGRALDMYQDAHDLLVREAVPAPTLAELVAPATPVILAELTSDADFEFDPAHTYAGYIDVAVETGRFGDVKEADFVSSSPGTPPEVVQRARTHVFETRFRPRFDGQRPKRSDRFNVRYYYDYGDEP